MHMHCTLCFQKNISCDLRNWKFMDLIQVFGFIWIWIVNVFCKVKWNMGSDIMPYNAECIIVGYNVDRNVGYLLGGYHQNSIKNVYNFTILNSSYIVFNEMNGIINAPIYGCNGPTYASNDNIIYMAQFDPSYIYISTFNMNSIEYISEYSIIRKDNVCSSDQNACVLSNDNSNIIYILCKDSFYSIDLDKNISIQLDSPKKHVNATCLWYNNFIVVISGANTKSIQYYYRINDNWNHPKTISKLTSRISNAYSFVINSNDGDYIYLFGGLNHYNNSYSYPSNYGYYLFITQTEITMDITKIKESTDLTNGVYNMASLYINQRIIFFGGNTNNIDTNTWYYSNIIAPTQSPTKYTLKPSVSPTQITLKPTQSPTKSPSNSPTESPTNATTKEPTTEPSIEPTTKSTKDPTIEPTNNPIIITSFPTHSPSIKTNNSKYFTEPIITTIIILSFISFIALMAMIYAICMLLNETLCNRKCSLISYNNENNINSNNPSNDNEYNSLKSIDDSYSN